MNSPSLRVQPRHFRFTLALAAMVLLGLPAYAASGTWTDGSSDSWNDPGAWMSGTIPGSTNLGTNRDIATFNTTTGVTVNIGPASEYLGSIQFDGSRTGDNGNIGSFTFNNDGGSDSFALYSPSSSGANKQNSIYILSSVNNASASATETFNAPIIIEASQGFDNDATSSSVVLDIAGNVSAAGTFTLYLNGSNTGQNTISGLISDGTGKLTLDVGGSQNASSTVGSATWVLSDSNNSFSGGIYFGATGSVSSPLNASTLSYNNVGDLGSTSNTISFGLGGTTTAGSGDLLYTGSTGTVSNGLIINTAGTVNPTFTQSGTGTLNYTGNWNITASTTGTYSDTITLNGSTSGTGEMSGTITDVQSGATTGEHIKLVKSGTGTWILAGNNTYAGGTTISGGNLQLNSSVMGSTSSATGTGSVTLSGGTTTTLSGTGGAMGLVTVTNGSRIAPGINTSGTNGNFGNPGTLTAAGGLTLTSANLDFDLGTTNAAMASDQINTAALTIAALTFNFSGTTLATGVEYDLITDTSESGSTSGIATNFEGVLAGAYTAQYTVAGGSNNDDLEVEFTAVATPEPSTWALLLGGLGLLTVWSRGLKRRDEALA